MSMASTEKELLKWLENRNEATQARVYRKWFLWKLKAVYGRDESDEVYQKLAGPQGVNTTKPTEDLKESLKDGTLLCRLAEIFTRKTIIKGGPTAWFENPSNSDEAIKNITVGLGHFVADGVAVAGYDPKTLHSGVKMMKEWFAVLWTIIMRYQIEVGQDTLIKFLAECCLPQGVVISDLLASWLDGRAFAALATRFKPGLFAQGSLETKGQHRREDLLGPAFKAGEELGIPALLDAAVDFGDHTSDRVITLYAYQYYDTFGPPAETRALKKKAAELAQTVIERDQQLARSATELRYLVNSHQEVRSLLEDQRGAMREANRKVMELSLKLPFYTGGSYKQKIPPPDEGNITLVMTAVYNSNILWDTVPEAMAQALRIHNRLLLDSIEEFEGYGANMDGGTFTIAFADPVNALKFSNKIQRDLLEADWPEELLEAPDAAPQYADPETKKKLLFNGLRVKIAIHHGEPLCHQDAFGRATYSGSEVSLTSSLLCVTNPGQIVISGAALKAIREELGLTSAEPGTESEVSEEQIPRISLGKDIEGVNQELEARALGDVKITSEESTTIFSILPLDLIERSEHFKVIEFSDAELVDVRSVLLGKVEELQLQNQKLKDRLADMEQKASTATKRANELQQWLSSCVATPVVSTEETLRDAKENLRRIMEEHHDLKDTLVMVKKQNDHLQGVLKQLAAELRETTFDQKMTTNQLNQITRLHKTCPSTIHALRKERDELLKKLGKNKGFLNKLMTKVGIKKEEAVATTSTATEEQVEEEAASEATDAQKPESQESKEPSEPTSTPTPGEASEGTPSEGETVTTKPAENAEPSEKPENDATAAPSEPPKEAVLNAEEAGSSSSKPRLHRSRSSRSSSSRKLKKQESVSAVDGGKKKHRDREGKSERDKTPEAKAEREKERAERKKRKAERAERKARAAAEAAAASPTSDGTTPPAEQPTA